MKKHFIWLLAFGLVAGGSYAQVVDTLAIGKNDTINSISADSIYLSPTAKALQEVEVTAVRPLFAVDGEKELYNVSEDPSVQTGTASDALQNAPGVEVDAEGNITLRGTQSVDVWINDRPSHLSGETLRQYIKNLPANAIDRIEVITNPSARYGGGGPVVNIVTRTKIKRNEFFSFGATGNMRPQVSPWVSYVYSGKKLSFNVYLEYDYSHTWSEQNGGSTLFTPTGDTSAMKSYAMRNDYWRHGSFAYISGHYDFDTLRTLYYWAGAYPSSYSSVSNQEMSWRELIYMPGDYSYHCSSQNKIPQAGYYGGLHYSRQFDDQGHMLWVRADMSGFGYKCTSEEWRDYVEQPLLSYHLCGQSMKNGGNRTSMEVGYSRPFATNWEAVVGARLSYQFPQHYMSTIDSMPTFRRDLLRSYQRTNNEVNYHGYATLQRRIGHFTAKVGLQVGEQYSMVSYSGYTTVTNRGQYLYYVPSIHLSYSTEDMHNFTLSYTRRSALPDAEDLSSFIEYERDSYSTGNPNLLMSPHHTVEGNWNKFWDGFGSVGCEVFYTASTNQVATISDVAYNEVFGREVSFRKPMNIGSSQAAGGRLNVTYRPTAFFNTRFDVQLYNYGYRMMFRPDEWNEENLWTASVRLNVLAKLWDKLQLFGNCRYTTQQLGFMSYIEPCFTVDLGLSTDLWDRKLSIYLNVKDLLDSNRQASAGTNPYLLTSSNMHSSSRYISLGVTLRFGKMELESQSHRGSRAVE